MIGKGQKVGSVVDKKVGWSLILSFILMKSVKILKRASDPQNHDYEKDGWQKKKV